MQDDSPGGFVVEKAISALLKLLRDVFRLLVPLEPSLVLFVETPCLVLECFCSKVLLVRSLFVVKRIEERVVVHF